MPFHKFKIGQIVKFAPPSAPAGDYKVLQLMPPADNDFQYRIKSDREPHDRVVRESQLQRGA